MKTDDQPRARNISGLVKCTTYYFRISATNLDVNHPGSGSTNGHPDFRTNCEPTVVTEAVTGNSMNAATFNSTINPNGSATTYKYEYRVKTTVPWIPTADGPTIPAGNTPVAPNSVPVGGLTANTTYEVRAVASNATGGPTTATSSSSRRPVQAARARPERPGLPARPDRGSGRHERHQRHQRHATEHPVRRVRPAPQAPPVPPARVVRQARPAARRSTSRPETAGR